MEETDKELEEVVKNSYSYSMVLRSLGKAISGSSLRLIKKKIQNLDTSHFNHNNFGASSKKKLTKEQFLLSLKKNSNLHGPDSLKRFINYNIKEYKCEKCLNTEWNEHPIPLQVDHIDGDHYNNELENLQILCPNCHAQTKNWGGKKLKKIKYSNFCSCGKEITKKAKKCSKCNLTGQKTKIVWPSTEELIERVEKSNFSEVARELGVSDNAIRKRIKKYASLDL